jgi:hypothetical protein
MADSDDLYDGLGLDNDLNPALGMPLAPRPSQERDMVPTGFVNNPSSSASLADALPTEVHD